MENRLCGDSVQVCLGKFTETLCSAVWETTAQQNFGMTEPQVACNVNEDDEKADVFCN